jgi:hypothetical protein
LHPEKANEKLRISHCVEVVDVRAPNHLEQEALGLNSSRLNLGSDSLLLLLFIDFRRNFLDAVSFLLNDLAYGRYFPSKMI